MIAGNPFARCRRARWHGTSATATARKPVDSLFLSAKWGDTAIYTKYSIFGCYVIDRFEI